MMSADKIGKLHCRPISVTREILLDEKSSRRSFPILSFIWCQH